ncbi:MAG: SPOR domain-containing protein, partial [Alphaproteobacteria bacterium]
LLPALEWKNPDKGGGRRSITDLKGSLFPLTGGNRMTFTSNVESWGGDAGDEAGKWQYGWSCNIAGEEVIEVQAGSFDTFKILCGRVKPDELVFYYAPKIGHYVVMRIDDPANNSTITRNLVSFSRIALGGSPLPEDMAMIPPSRPTPPPAPVVPQPVTPAPQPKPASSPPAAAAGAGPRVHIASFSSEENATRGWGIFQRENTTLLGGLKPHVVRADLGSRGVYFRLMTQRLQDRAAARDLCRKLKARGVGCRVTSR